jgi:hypothetical protein
MHRTRPAIRQLSVDVPLGAADGHDDHGSLNLGEASDSRRHNVKTMLFIGTKKMTGGLKMGFHNWGG